MACATNAVAGLAGDLKPGVFAESVDPLAGERLVVDGQDAGRRGAMRGRVRGVHDLSHRKAGVAPGAATLEGFSVNTESLRPCRRTPGVQPERQSGARAY